MAGKRSTTKADAEVGKRVRTFRMQKGLSQTELATKIGVSFQQIQKYEKGTNRISSGRLEAIAAALGQPVTVLLPSMDRVNGISAQVFTEPSRDATRLLELFGKIRDAATKTMVLRLVGVVVESGRAR
jgi:transcriptional regulator with XRE-family HTH domain